MVKVLNDMLVLSVEYQTLLADSLTAEDGARILAAAKKGLVSDTWPCHGRASAFVEDQKTRNWMPAALATAKQNVDNLEREKDDLVRKNRERQEDSAKIAAALSAAEKEIAGLKQCKREWLAEKAALEETVETLKKDKREWLEKEDELMGRASTADALEAEELGWLKERQALLLKARRVDSLEEENAGLRHQRSQWSKDKSALASLREEFKLAKTEIPAEVSAHLISTIINTVRARTMRVPSFIAALTRHLENGDPYDKIRDVLIPSLSRTVSPARVGGAGEYR